MLEANNQKVRKQFLALLTNKWAIGCLTIIVFQQLLESSAVYWLVAMIQNLTAGKNFIPFLCFYLATLILPYIPRCFAFTLKITWKQEAQRNFTNAFVTSNRNRIREWSNKGIKEQKLSMLTAEGPMAIQALIDYVFDLTDYVASVVFNILALSIVVEPLFGFAYGISLALVFTVMAANRNTQRKLTKKALIARIDLCQSLLESWDNVLLGNHYNFKLWDEKTKDRLNRCLERNVNLEKFDQILAVIICLLTSIPSLIVVLYYVHSNYENIPKLTAFLATLPLLFQILLYTYYTLSLTFRWGMHRSKLISIYKAIQTAPDQSEMQLETKIKWGKLSLTQTAAPQTHISAPGPKHLQSHVDLLQFTSSPGRFTLRGENGSGKSTLLMILKNCLSEKAFFLPAQSQLSFVSETTKSSTGESLQSRLKEILERVEADVLLLDEWDANLDGENQEKLTLLINAIAEKKCVIEVRHRV